MGKLILIALGIALAWWLLKRYQKSLMSGKPPPTIAEDMVKCAHCGVHLPRSESQALNGEIFCSEEHQRLHR